MTATATLTAPAATTIEVATDHEISVATAAQALGIQPATAKRYLRSGKLARLGGGISADSVEAYRTRRDANVARTRFHKAAAASETEAKIAAAKAALDRAAKLEAEAKALRAQTKKTLEAIGVGEHGTWEVYRTKAQNRINRELVEALCEEVGRDVKTVEKETDPSWKVRRLAA